MIDFGAFPQFVHWVLWLALYVPAHGWPGIDLLLGS